MHPEVMSYLLPGEDVILVRHGKMGKHALQLDTIHGGYGHYVVDRRRYRGKSQTRHTGINLDVNGDGCGGPLGYLREDSRVVEGEYGEREISIDRRLHHLRRCPSQNQYGYVETFLPQRNSLVGNGHREGICTGFQCSAGYWNGAVPVTLGLHHCGDPGSSTTSSVEVFPDGRDVISQSIEVNLQPVWSQSPIKTRQCPVSLPRSSQSFALQFDKGLGQVSRDVPRQ